MRKGHQIKSNTFTENTKKNQCKHLAALLNGRKKKPQFNQFIKIYCQALNHTSINLSYPTVRLIFPFPLHFYIFLYHPHIQK